MISRVRKNFSKIEFETSYSKESISTIKKMILLDPSNNEAKIEFVLRTINGESQLEEEAKTICDHMLRSDPQHNFYHLARAMLDINVEQELLLACHSPTPYGQCISAQAAYQLARYYFSLEKYIESQAWLIDAVIKGYDKAEADFCSRGCAIGNKFINAENEKKLFKLIHPESNYKAHLDNPCLSSMMRSMMIAIVLAGKKLKYLDDIKIDGSFCFYKDAASWIGSTIYHLMQYANKTVFPAAALQNVDTTLHHIAKKAIAEDAMLFFEFMSYCMKNSILTVSIYENILMFLKNFSSHQEQILFQTKGIEILQQFKQEASVTTMYQTTSSTSYAGLLSQLLTTQGQQPIPHPSQLAQPIINTPRLIPIVTPPMPPPNPTANMGSSLNLSSFVSSHPVVQNNPTTSLQPVYRPPGGSKR